MSEPARLSINLEIQLDGHQTSPEALAEIAREAIEERIRAGIFGPGDEIGDWNVTAAAGPSPVQEIADQETWFERCLREAIREGFRDPQEIAAMIFASQTDLDYLVEQDRALEEAIASCRRHLGRPSGEFASDAERLDAIRAELARRGIEPAQTGPDGPQ
jgi:hypothetical protein